MKTSRLPECGTQVRRSRVSVVKFFLENSLDDRMQDAQDRKREFITRALDGEDPSKKVEALCA
jgi:hypothetical protein